MNGKNDGDNNNNNSSRVEMEIVTQSAECGKWAVGREMQCKHARREKRLDANRN